MQRFLLHCCTTSWSWTATLPVLPRTNKTCLKTNQLVVGFEKFLRKVESNSALVSLVNKRFIIGPKKELFLRDQHKKSRAAYIDPGSQSQRRIRFILPAHGLRHIKKVLSEPVSSSSFRTSQSSWTIQSKQSYCSQMAFCAAATEYLPTKSAWEVR